MDENNVLIYDSMNGENRILEMAGVVASGGDNSYIDIPIDPRINMADITADDADPKFVNVEIIRAGISKTNRRRYNNAVVDQIGEMIIGRQGFLGHPDPSKMGFEFREPHCIFVGKDTQVMEDGNHRIIGKAYLFKGTPLREWIPKSIAAGRPMTVSINGTGDLVRNGEVLDVIRMNDIDSIDWANPGTEGIPTSMAMSIVNEMQNKNTGGNNMDVKEILKNASVTEFKAYNPDGYTSIVAGVTVTELQTHNPAVVKAIEDGAKVTEMQLTMEGASKMVKIAELQDILTAYDAKVTELQGKLEDHRISEYKNSKLVELVPEGIRAKIAGRIVGKTEADIDKSIQAEMDYIREMGLPLVGGKVGSQTNHSMDDLKQLGESIFGSGKKDTK